MKKLLYNNINKYLLPLLLIIIVLWLSYWSSYHFKFSNLSIEINFEIKDISLFWMTFSSISTLIGIMVALFRSNVYNFLFIPELKVSLSDKTGTIFIKDNSIVIVYLLKVENTTKIKLKEVDFFFDSIKENDDEDTLQIRRPMAWARKEEERENIEIFNHDHLDFVYCVIKIQDCNVFYYFESRKPLVNVNYKIKNKTDVIVLPRYQNQKENKKYHFSIEFNRDKKVEILRIIGILKYRLCQELEDIKTKKNSRKSFKKEEYELLNIAYNDDEFNIWCIKDGDVYIQNFKTIGAYVDNYLTYKLIYEFYKDNTLLERIDVQDSKEFILNIAEIMKIKLNSI